jgi:aminoglycoside phosphotransferase (APT) family kinase protein
MDRDYKAVIHKGYPDLEVESISKLGEGWNNTALEVNGNLIFRFAKDDETKNGLRKETELLPIIGRGSPLPVPEPIYFNETDGYMGYRKLEGEPLLSQHASFRLAEWPEFAQTIGRFLSAINSISRDSVSRLVDEELDPLESWLDTAEEGLAKVRYLIPSVHMQSIEAFLLERAPSGNFVPVFAHNDLGIEHILVNIRTRNVTGVIDWGDAAIADPAYDMGMLYRDAGEEMLDAVMGHYRSAENPLDAMRERAIFYARCTVFEDMAYGLTSGRQEYIQKGLTSLNWLFV